jgi:deoxyribodipyrimidine photo-lyase
MKKFKKSLFIFRNDYRLEDNLGLIKALETSEIVIPIFIFNKKQISNENEYRTLNGMQFIKTSLKELNDELIKLHSKLYMFDFEIDEVIRKLKKDYDIEAIFFNSDYTPFSRKRDKKILETSESLDISCFSVRDKLLVSMEEGLKINGEVYNVFTPYYKKNSLLGVNKPKKNKYKNYFDKKISYSIDEFPSEFNYYNPNIIVFGGRIEGKKLLFSNTEKLKIYGEKRDFPEPNYCSKLSAHIKYGTLSIREIFYFLKDNYGNDHPLIRQLYWRNFFYSIAYYYPYVFGNSFQKKYDKIKWNKDLNLLEKWKKGETGFPIVDAGMRELNKTGYMHNRSRMNVASFLVKDLHIDWREGEKYFASKLVDYDPILNNSNWQWAASTGCDAQPYFRIFNPWRQAKRFDPDCKYIKKWIPELKKFSPEQIHNIEAKNLQLGAYPKPIVIHSIESQIAKDIFKSCK